MPHTEAGITIVHFANPGNYSMLFYAEFSFLYVAFLSIYPASALYNTDLLWPLFLKAA